VPLPVCDSVNAITSFVAQTQFPETGNGLVPPTFNVTPVVTELPFSNLTCTVMPCIMASKSGSATSFAAEVAAVEQTP